MEPNLLLNRSIIEAIGLSSIIKFVLILALELGVYLFVARQNPKLRRNISIVVPGFWVLDLFCQSQVLSYIWFIASVVVIVIFVRPIFGSESEFQTLDPATRRNRALRAYFGSLALFFLMCTLLVSSSVFAGIMQGPLIVQKEVQYKFQDRQGNVWLQFDDKAGNFIDIQLSEDYKTLIDTIEKRECLELTYFEPPLKPFAPFDIFKDYVTQIRRSDGCQSSQN